MTKKTADGKRMIELSSGNILLIGIDNKRVFICNTGGDNNDTTILKTKELECLVTELNKCLKNMYHEGINPE